MNSRWISLDVGELGKGPAAVAAVIVHAGHPIDVHSGFLLFGVLPSIALDFDDEMQEIVLSMAIVDEDDKIRKVRLRPGGVTVRDLETEIVVLDVGFDLRMGFADAAKFRFPSRCRGRPS